ncbi:MAG TPA: cytochrome c peroxidase [Burkholderiales bacterium]|nr:cytochrome c peroxidase [Burkholderiales bacterium]
MARLYTVLIIGCAILSACGGGSPETSRELSSAAQLGEKIFHDTSLSASGRMACATCHDPAFGHASPFDTPVALGGPALDQPGERNPPSLRYLRFNRAFRFDAEGTPTGGFNWDGRANSLADQARRPFLSTNEMANADVGSVISRIAAAPYAGEFKQLFGADILSDPQAAFDRVVFALERYQLEDPEFAPFSSKYDRFLARKATLTDQELRGLVLFNLPDKGNCAACHPGSKPANAPAPLFTDFTYDSLGVPRNMAIGANADPQFFDMGLCGPRRQDLAMRGELCGAFKVPSLRNVGLRKHFFHNGRFDSLEDVIRFYVTRDTNPELWYPPASLTDPLPYSDLPVDLRSNVNTSEGPYNRLRGQAPALTESEIGDLASFLRTLTDGYPE